MAGWRENGCTNMRTAQKNGNMKNCPRSSGWERVCLAASVRGALYTRSLCNSSSQHRVTGQVGLHALISWASVDHCISLVAHLRTEKRAKEHAYDCSKVIEGDERCTVCAKQYCTAHETPSTVLLGAKRAITAPPATPPVPSACAHLKHRRRPHAAANAHADHAKTRRPPAPAHLVKQSCRAACACCTQGVAQRDGSTIGVDFVRGYAQGGD